MTIKTDTKYPQNLFSSIILYISLLAFIQFVVAAIFTLSIIPDQKNGVLVGFSIQRLALVFISLIVASVFLVVGMVAQKRNVTYDSLSTIFKNRTVRILLKCISILLVIWGGFSFYCPPTLLREWVWGAYFERIQPFSDALGLTILEYWSFLLINHLKLSYSDQFYKIKSEFLRPILISSLPVLGIGALIAYTKIGLVEQTAYWNVAGIPISGFQFLLIVLFIVLSYFIFLKNQFLFDLLSKTNTPWIIAIAIYIIAVVVWGNEPMLRHFFSLQPSAPFYQPYPYSDARIHDVGGLSILNGTGIYFNSYTDKPLYMVLLSILHIFAGYNYSLLIWLQIFILGLIPVTLFFFGKEFHSMTFGLLLSIGVIIQQRNAIFFSIKISSANPKLLLTEMITLLGIIFLTYQVFLWFKYHRRWQGLLTGGVIGAITLIRLNPLLLFPAVASLIIPAFWKSPKKIIQHFSYFSLGFLILISPWIISGVSPDGKPWLLIKFIDVINARYDPQINQIQQPFINNLQPSLENQFPFQIAGISPTSLSGNFHSLPMGLILGNLNQTPDPFTPNIILDSHPILISGLINNSILIFEHFLHNISTSILSMPESPLDYDLDQLGMRAYWQDSLVANWNGSLPTSQTILIFLNLFIIAVGLGYGWKRYHWIGLTPLFIFVTYSLALGLAMDSGGRYIVPIDWIVYFYYSLAIVLIIRFIFGLFMANNRNLLVPNKKEHQNTSDRKPFWLTLVCLICLASLIPIANNLIPAVTKHPNEQTIINNALKEVPYYPDQGERLISGKILYPYLETKEKFDFSIITNQDVEDFSIDVNQKPANGLIDGRTVILINNVQAGINQVDSIYILNGDRPDLIWSRP